MRTIGDRQWSIGGLFCLSLSPKPILGAKCNWSDGKGLSYSVTNMTQETQPGKAQEDFPVVHEAGMNSGHIVWKIGEAFLKLVIPHSKNVTREHVTLDAVKDMLSADTFAIPRVLFHGDWNGRYFLAVTEMPGVNLHEAWPKMSEELKSACVQHVTDLCLTLAENVREKISGIDGNHLPELYLTKNDQADSETFAPLTLERTCKEIGMDCSDLRFYHCDLIPGNIIVDLKRQSFAVIDWECAGFVPQEWIGTKCAVNEAMRLERPENCNVDQYSEQWRKRIVESLTSRGFGNVASCSWEWFRHKK